MHPAQTRTSARFRILIDSKASASLRCSGCFQANILFSVAYRLFGALAALFRLPVLCFQALADSFVKTGGEGYPLQEAAARNLPAGPDSILQDGRAVLVDRDPELGGKS